MNNNEINYWAHILFVVVFFAMWVLAPSGECNSEKALKKVIINGIVVKKFIDKDQHMYPTIRCNS